MSATCQGRWMEFGDVLKIIGEFGWFQKRLVALLCVPNFLTPFHLFGQVFIALHVPHYCNTSWIHKLGLNLTEEQELNLTIPRKPDGTLEECRMVTPVQGPLQSLQFNSTEECRDGWVYPGTLQPTLRTEFNLVCQRETLHDIAQSIFMAGVLIGALFFGPLSDRIGSRKTILVTLLMMGFFGVGAGLAPNLNVYIFMKLLVGTAFAGLSISMPALMSEWVGSTHRPLAMIITHCFISGGQLALAALAYGVRNWRHYQILGSLPAICLFVYVWILPRSARWLLTRGKVDEAIEEIEKAALLNKRSVPRDLRQQLYPQRKAKSGSIVDLFRKAHLRKITFVMAWLWFTDSLVYYGMGHQVGDFGLNIYITQLVFGVTEIPARIASIFMMHWLGRKKCQAGWLLLGGVVCMIIPAVPQTFPVAVTVLAVINKAAIGASFSTTYVWSVEVFPTVVRQTCLGLCSVSARIGGIIAPLTNLLDKMHPAMSMVVYGGTSLIGGILCFLLHETQNRDLQDDTTELPLSKEQLIAEICRDSLCTVHRSSSFLAQESLSRASRSENRDLRGKTSGFLPSREMLVTEICRDSLLTVHGSSSLPPQGVASRDSRSENRNLQDNSTELPPSREHLVTEIYRNTLFTVPASSSFPTQEAPSRNSHSEIQRDSQRSL